MQSEQPSQQIAARERGEQSPKRSALYLDRQSAHLFLCKPRSRLFARRVPRCSRSICPRWPPWLLRLLFLESPGLQPPPRSTSPALAKLQHCSPAPKLAERRTGLWRTVAGRAARVPLTAAAATKKRPCNVRKLRASRLSSRLRAAVTQPTTRSCASLMQGSRSGAL